jgi:hypothetical protein
MKEGTPAAEPDAIVLVVYLLVVIRRQPVRLASATSASL